MFWKSKAGILAKLYKLLCNYFYFVMSLINILLLQVGVMLLNHNYQACDVERSLPRSQIHNNYCNTRNVLSFHLPLCRTNTRQFSIYFQGPKFYNSLNSVITGSSSSASFKRKLKEFLLSMY